MTSARRDKRMWLLGVIILLFVGLPWKLLASSWFSNLAMIQLIPPWLAQANWTFNAPCEETANLPQITQYLKKSSDLAHQPARLQTQLGRIAWLEGQCSKAISMWQQAMSQGDMFAGYELARVGKERVLPLSQKTTLADQAYAYGIALRDKGNYQVAFQWFEHAFELLPQHRNAVALAAEYERQGQNSEVSALWQRMVGQFAPSDPDYWWATAKLHEQNGDWVAAGLAYEQGAALSSDPYDFWLYAGRAWEKTPEWNRAVTAYESAAVTTSSPIFAYLGLGFGYLGQGDYQEALRYLRLAQNADSDYYRSYYYLGLTYYQMQEYENARLNLELALERSPEDSSIMYQLAQVWYYGLQQPEAAEAWLVRAVNQPQLPSAAWWLELGDWYLAQQRCRDAEQAYFSAQSAGVEKSMIQTRSGAYTEVCGANPLFSSESPQDNP